MEICVLNSGSNGNSIYITSGDTAILIDAGISQRAIKTRLKSISRDLTDIKAICITHEHTDHCNGLPILTKNWPHIELYANEGTASGVEITVRKELHTHWSIFETGTTFQIGELKVKSFSVPHDCGDPVAYVVTDGKYRVGIATDLGTVTSTVKHHLSDCDALILETNHDSAMLRESGRSWSLIQRIQGRQGHLSNDQAVELLDEVLCDRLKAIFPAHISADCNTLDNALVSVREVLQRRQRTDIEIIATYRDRQSQLVSLK